MYAAAAQVDVVLHVEVEHAVRRRGRHQADAQVEVRIEEVVDLVLAVDVDHQHVGEGAAGDALRLDRDALDDPDLVVAVHQREVVLAGRVGPFHRHGEPQVVAQPGVGLRREGEGHPGAGLEEVLRQGDVAARLGQQRPRLGAVAQGEVDVDADAVGTVRVADVGAGLDPLQRTAAGHRERHPPVDVLLQVGDDVLLGPSLVHRGVDEWPGGVQERQLHADVAEQAVGALACSPPGSGSSGRCARRSRCREADPASGRRSRGRPAARCPPRRRRAGW